MSIPLASGTLGQCCHRRRAQVFPHTIFAPALVLEQQKQNKAQSNWRRKKPREAVHLLAFGSRTPVNGKSGSSVNLTPSPGGRHQAITCPSPPSSGDSGQKLCSAWPLSCCGAKLPRRGRKAARESLMRGHSQCCLAFAQPPLWPCSLRHAGTCTFLGLRSCENFNTHRFTELPPPHRPCSNGHSLHTTLCCFSHPSSQQPLIYSPMP